MPPQKRATAKAETSVKVEPASAAEPRKSTTTKKEVEAAVEQSAEHLQRQAEGPSDVHPGPTTPSKAEVESAVEQSAEFLEEQAEPPQDVHPRSTTPPKSEVEAAVEQSAEHLRRTGQIVTSDESTKGTAASPVFMGGRNPGDAQPVDASRDKTADAAPIFSAPITDKPREE